MTALTPPPPPGTHEVDVERRFSDLDLLGHVNNVRYLDYLDEGVARLLRHHDVGGGVARVRAHRLEFAQPMLGGRTAARVRTGVVGVEGDEVHVAQEVATGAGAAGSGDRGTVHLRAESWWRVADATALADVREHADPTRAHVWRPVSAPVRPHRHALAVTVRARDVGVDGLVRADAVVEYFQEARVRYLADLHRLVDPEESATTVVVARADVTLAGDVGPQDDVEVRSRVAHLGGTSFTIGADLHGAGTTRATATVVAVFVDAEQQRPTPVPPDWRARLEAELTAAAAEPDREGWVST